MPTAIVTGSGGLIGSESVQHFVEAGYDVIGLDNDMRAYFFGSTASTAPTTDRLLRTLGGAFQALELDIRDAEAVDQVFAQQAASLELVIHSAAQPSHDWAASEPQTDFTVNANGTSNLLESTRRHAPDATFIFCSTNKVYGDLPNHLPLVELDARLELAQGHRYFGGIDTSMSIDASTHSLFGVSKAAADLLVQEYGRYFDMPTVCFRGGCLTGPNHAGAKLHGFLSYLMRCTMTGERIHRVRLWRQAGAGQHPLRRPGQGVRGVPRGPEDGCRLQHRGRAREQLLGDRSHRDVPVDRRSRALVGARGPGPDRRSPVVDLRSGTVSPRLPRLGHHVRHRGRPARDPRAERRAVGGGTMKLSVVIPAHNEAESIGETVACTVNELERAQIDYEVVVVDDASGDGTGEVVRRIAERTRTSSAFAPLCRWASGTRSGQGLIDIPGDAVAIMMADLSDSPKDLVLYYRVLEQGYDCAFGTRFGQGGSTHDYPRLKLVLNQDRQRGDPDPLPARVQRHDQRFQGLPSPSGRPASAAALQPLQPDR